MNLINNNLLEKYEYLLQLQKLNKCLSNIETNFDETNNESVHLISNNNFDIKLLKTKLYFQQILEKRKKTKLIEYYMCFWPKCQYKAKRLTNFKRHQLIHKNIKQFKCDFNNSHKRIHSGKKSFVCDINNCGKKFIRISKRLSEL